MHDITEDEVIKLLYRGHDGPPGELAATIARVTGHGPFKRITLPGARIGRLKFQPAQLNGQCSLSSFFLDQVSQFEEWLDSLDEVALKRQQAQIELLSSNGKFDLPPIYDFEGQVLDGGHRTRAAYYAYLQSGNGSDVVLDVICDGAALP